MDKNTNKQNDINFKRNLLIRANILAVNSLNTSGVLSEEDKNALCEEIPAGRMGTAKEVADTVILLSEAGNYLTGQIITLDGGWI